MKCLIPISLIAILLLVFTPVSALKLNFQNYGDLAEIVTTVGSPSWSESAVGGNNYIAIGTGSGIRNKNPQSFTYCSFWIPSRNSNSPSISLYDSGLTQIASMDLPAGGSNVGLYEVKIIGGTVKLYLNGALVGTGPTLSVNPSYISFFAQYAISGYSLDNVVIGTAETPYVIGMPETNLGGASYYVLKKSIIDPANSGLANGATYAVVSSNNMTTTFSKNNADAEIMYLKHTGTGEIVWQENVSGYTGSVVWPLQEAVFNKITSQAPYGSYIAYLSGSPSTVSTPIQYISSGATITFNQDLYSNGDLATYAWNIQPDYWNLRSSGYSYSTKVIDVYGQTKATAAVTSSAFYSTYTFAESDPDSVYYVALIATDPSGNEIWVAYDYATLTGYLTFIGYINDAQTARNLTVANVSITQGTTVSNTVTASGNYTTAGTAFGAGQAITFNVTAPGYQRYNFTFTPIATKTVNPMNFTLIPNNPTGVGVSLLGRDLDDVYARPLAGATVTLTNVSHGITLSTTTNNAGAYQFNSLTSGYCYRVNSSLTRYTQVAPSAMKCVV